MFKVIIASFFAAFCSAIDSNGEPLAEISEKCFFDIEIDG